MQGPFFAVGSRGIRNVSHKTTLIGNGVEDFSTSELSLSITSTVLPRMFFQFLSPPYHFGQGPICKVLYLRVMSAQSQ